MQFKYPIKIRDCITYSILTGFSGASRWVFITCKNVCGLLAVEGAGGGGGNGGGGGIAGAITASLEVMDCSVAVGLDPDNICSADSFVKLGCPAVALTTKLLGWEFGALDPCKLLSWGVADVAGLELSKLLGGEAAASLKIRLVGCEVGAGVSLYCCKPGLVTNSILFCWNFKIKDRCKKVPLQQTHNRGLRQLLLTVS